MRTHIVTTHTDCSAVGRRKQEQQHEHKDTQLRSSLACSVAKAFTAMCRVLWVLFKINKTSRKVCSYFLVLNMSKLKALHKPRGKKCSPSREALILLDANMPRQGYQQQSKEPKACTALVLSLGRARPGQARDWEPANPRESHTVPSLG